MPPWRAFSATKRMKEEHEMILRGWGLKSASGWLTLAVFCAALAAGGGTHQGIVSDTIIQLASLPLLGSIIFLAAGRPITRQTVIPLVLAVAVVFVPVLQLIPLPPNIWSALPGRGFVLASFAQADMTPPWLPISLMPETTLRSFLSLAPPAAIFLATAFSSLRARFWMILAFILAAGLNVALGLMQLSDGPDSPLRFYAVTNVSHPVGFFANRNHFSAILYSAVPYIGVLAVWLTHSRRADARIVAALCVVVYLVLMLGVSLAASRAGLALAFAAGLGVAALAWLKSARSEHASPVVVKLLLVGGGAFTILVMIVFGSAQLANLLDSSVLQDARVAIANSTWAAARSFAPIGSGVGTFVPVYLMFEDPRLATSEYVNRAHNDLLELWLETGVAGVAVMLAFLAWVVAVSVRNWRGRNDDPFDLAPMLGLASMLVIALLALHSLVDYPLRTTALACVFALACGNLVPVTTSEDRQLPFAPEPARPTRRKPPRKSTGHRSRART
jgi:O-antigen ligase